MFEGLPGLRQLFLTRPSVPETRLRPETDFDRKRLVRDMMICGLVALGVRFVAAACLTNGFQPSLWEYEDITLNMMTRGEFVLWYRDYGEYYALEAPGYPVLSFLVYSLFGVNHQLMLLVQFLLALLLGFCVYLLSWRLFRCQIAARFAALLVLVHPGIAVYGATKLHSFNLYVPLCYAVTLLLVICHQQQASWAYVLLGLVGAAAVLSRATFLPVILLSLLILCLTGRGSSWPRRTAWALLCLAVLVAGNLPWTVRNYRVLGQAFFSQTNGWEQLWVGNNLHATGTHYTANGQLVLAHKPPEMQAELAASASELTDAAIFKKYTLAYIREHPGHFVQGLLSKGWRFWWFHPQTGLFYPRSALMVYKAFYLAVLGLGLLGLYSCQRRRLWSWEMTYPILLLLMLAAAHTLAFGEMRHRWTVEPVILLFSGLGLAELWRAIARGAAKG